MNMSRFTIGIFTMAVLLGGAAASGFLCIIQELLTITPDHFFTSPTSACRNLEFKFRQARKGLKKCTEFTIDTHELENLYREFCDPQSVYRHKFDSQKMCLRLNMRNSMSCLSTMEQSQNLTPENLFGKTMKQICQSVSEEVSGCLNEHIGKPCGEEGIEVYGRITKASAPFFEGSCLAAAASALGDSDTLLEINKAEQGVVEATVTENYSGLHSAATASSTVLWCILLGLLLTLKWW